MINEAVVVDGKPHPPANMEQLRILPGVQYSLRKLKKIGFVTLVVTNQPDVARGKTTMEFVQKIHDRLTKELPIDGFYTCWHDEKEECFCRKPKPGLIRKAADEHGINLFQSFMVGDRWRDVEAGQAAGCRTVFLVGSMRHADELSITTVPTAANFGAHSRDVSPPAEKIAKSKLRSTAVCIPMTG